MLWIKQPEVLFDPKELKYYMPGPNLTWEQQANALIRFVIYLSLLVYLFKGNPMHLIVPPLMVMGIQYYLYTTGQLQPLLIKMFNPKPTEAEITQSAPNSGATNDLVKLPTDLPSGTQIAEQGIATNATSTPSVEDPSPPSDDQVIETFQPGFKPGMSRQLRLKQPMDLHKDAEMENQVDRMLAEELGISLNDQGREPKNTIGPRPDMQLLPNEPQFQPKQIDCKPPTRDNPFGNAMPFDPIEKQVTRACPNEFSKDQKFYSGLFNSLDDIFDRNNSQRQFTTNPASTRINDREAAMQFFYNTPYTEH